VGKAKAFIITALLLFAIYLMLAGTLSVTDVVFGVLAAACVSALTYDILVKDPGKLSLSRLAYLIKYALKYFIIYEVRAHLDVARRALSPSLPINPGFVEVPYDLRSEYGVLLVANSVTNTPGTVTVAVDEENRKLFIHWIDVSALDPERCRELITKEFEEYARKIFEHGGERSE